MAAEKAAGAIGAIGPNLDQLRPSAAVLSAIVRSGSGSMPSFSGKLTDSQIAAVATSSRPSPVAEAAGYRRG